MPLHLLAKIFKRPKTHHHFAPMFLLACAGAKWLPASAQATPSQLQGRALTTFQTPWAVERVSLTTHTGNAFSAEALKGRWTVVGFGFTQCTTICPMIVSQLSAIAKATQSRAPDSAVAAYFVTVEPQTDTPKVLGRYLSKFPSPVVGLTGTLSAVNDFASRIGSRADAAATDVNSTLSRVAHSGNLFLLNTRAEVVGYFAPPLEPQKITKDISALMTPKEASL